MSFMKPGMSISMFSVIFNSYDGNTSGSTSNSFHYCISIALGHFHIQYCHLILQPFGF